jgi:mevalonate kinase
MDRHSADGLDAQAPERRVAAPPLPVVRVPGKVMLSGEYAVLREATAVLLPLQRTLRLEGSSGGHRAAGSLAGEVPAAAATPESPVIANARRVYLPQVSNYEREHGEPQFVIDASEFHTVDAQGQRHKLGIGGSSAEAVGVVALRYACAGLDWHAMRDSVCRAALDAHERAQGGIGSGADVAACAYGIPLRFRRVLGEVELRPISPPPPAARVPLALVWSGVEADSRRQLERYLTWRSLAGHEGRSAEHYLQREADQLAALWFAAGQDELFAALDTFCQALAAIAEEAGLTWQLPVHARLDAWARRHGGRAKPTGAGAGDMVLLIGDLPLDKLGLLTIPLDYAALWPEACNSGSRTDRQA